MQKGADPGFQFNQNFLHFFDNQRPTRSAVAIVKCGWVITKFNNIIWYIGTPNKYCVILACRRLLFSYVGLPAFERFCQCQLMADLQRCHLPLTLLFRFGLLFSLLFFMKHCVHLRVWYSEVVLQICGELSRNLLSTDQWQPQLKSINHIATIAILHASLITSFQHPHPTSSGHVWQTN